MPSSMSNTMSVQGMAIGATISEDRSEGAYHDAPFYDFYVCEGAREKH
jgi:hypothetical protein